MTERPSAIVGDHLVLNRDGARLLLAALELAMSNAERNGVNARGRDRWDDVQWLAAQARTVAAGAAGGTGGTVWRLDLGASDGTWSTRQAAALLKVTPAPWSRPSTPGTCPPRGSAASGLLRELDVRQYAGRRNGGRAGARTRAEAADKPRADRGRSDRVGESAPARP